MPNKAQWSIVVFFYLLNISGDHHVTPKRDQQKITSLFSTISRSTVVVGQLVGFWIKAHAPLHQKDPDTFLAVL